MIRVLIVDDSAFARKVLRESLTNEHGFELLGFARDGLEALELITQLEPDVITLDLVMPNLDGLGLLHQLKSLPRAPRVVVVSTADASSALGLEALAQGAFDVVRKPSALPSPILYEMADGLRETVRAAATAKRPRVASTPAKSVVVAPLATTRRIVVVGTSTGGPPALTRLLTDLPGNFPVPIAIVLHIPIGYTEALAKRLNQASALAVVEASDGREVTAGQVILARAGDHLRLERRGSSFVARLSQTPVMTHCPSIDVLFESVLAEGAAAVAVVLTGMGDDGLIGSTKLKAAGATVLTEAETSCVVYGMPRAVSEAHLSDAEAPIEAMAELLVRSL